MRSSCSGGGPAGIIAAASAARAGRKTLLIERYGFLGGMGTAAGVTNFCGLHGNVYGPGPPAGAGAWRPSSWHGSTCSTALNTPHLILGKVFAQAYDTAAYKIAADELLASHKVNILFHALGAGVVMGDNSRIDALDGRGPRPAGRRCARRSSSTAPVTAISRSGPGRRSKSATNTAIRSTRR
ncbi:hypothetical protein BRDID11002_15170 [Bradyrhizobium diazoefficiens]